MMHPENKIVLDKNKSILQQIANHKQAEVERRKLERPLETFKSSIQPLAYERSLEYAIRNAAKDKPALILEVKPSSPSQGKMRENLDSELPDILKLYERYAVGISVLTDTPFFGGSLSLLQQVNRQVSCPTLCKEFILDSYQVYEAREANAGAVLLIVKMIPDALLTALHGLILSLGMTPVVEIQNEDEMARALYLNPKAILINHRDLDTLTLDMETVGRLAPLVPDSVLCIGASGISNREMLLKLQAHCNAFLVGSALMKQPLHQWEKELQAWTAPIQAGALT